MSKETAAKNILDIHSGLYSHMYNRKYSKNCIMLNISYAMDDYVEEIFQLNEMIVKVIRKSVDMDRVDLSRISTKFNP